MYPRKEQLTESPKKVSRIEEPSCGIVIPDEAYTVNATSVLNFKNIIRQS